MRLCIMVLAVDPLVHPLLAREARSSLSRS